LHLQYLAKNQTTPCCQSLITPESDHPPVLEPHRSSEEEKVVGMEYLVYLTDVGMQIFLFFQDDKEEKEVGME
jgi:hypothetical protein